MLGDVLGDFVQQKKLILHLGAHKTATTYIQAALNAQRQSLRSKGLSLVLPSDLRSTGDLQRTRDTRETPKPDASATPDLTSLLHDLAADPRTRRIVVSEEAFIGSARKNLARKTLYPDLPSNLESLPDVLNHPNVTILFSVRDYGSFFSSNVTTAVRRGNIFALNDLRSSLLMLHRSWVDVVSELRARFPAASLQIWRYEQFQALEAQIFAEFAPGFVAPASARKFETLSTSAMQRILDLADPANGLEETRPIVLASAKKFPISDKNPPFSLWSADEAAHLTYRYELDWQKICTRDPGIALRQE